MNQETKLQTHQQIIAYITQQLKKTSCVSAAQSIKVTHNNTDLDLNLPDFLCSIYCTLNKLGQCNSHHAAPYLCCPRCNVGKMLLYGKKFIKFIFKFKSWMLGIKSS